jgi:hypothetical protein
MYATLIVLSKGRYVNTATDAVSQKIPRQLQVFQCPSNNPDSVIGATAKLVFINLGISADPHILPNLLKGSVCQVEVTIPLGKSNGEKQVLFVEAKSVENGGFPEGASRGYEC